MRTFAAWLSRYAPRRRRAAALVRDYTRRVTAAAEPADARLARIARDCTTGALAGAELELFDWRRCDDCPPAAKVLLAALLARRGEVETALHVLPRRKRLYTRQDARIAQTLIAALAAADLNDTARRITHQLHHDLGHDTAVADWLRFMRMPGADTLEPLSHSVVEQLAADLIERFEVIPSLVAAQRFAPRADDIDLLRSALARLTRDVHDEQQTLTLCHAMADLAMLADDHDDARRWAHRGLKINAYSAPLALVLSEVDDNPAQGPVAAKVLQSACNAHPEYPDLRKAMILRYHRDGDNDAARIQLRRWLDREPSHPIANDLQKELAA